MKNSWKWIIGIFALLVLLQIATPFIWHWAFPSMNEYGYGMPMMRGYGWNHGMSMMGFGFGGILMWLTQIGLLALIVLGIAYLWKMLTAKPAK